MSVHVAVGRRLGSRLATMLVDHSFHHYFGSSISVAVRRRSDGRLLTTLVDLFSGPVGHGAILDVHPTLPRTLFFDKHFFLKKKLF